MHRWMGALVALALATPGCDGGGPEGQGLRVIREVGVDQSARWLEDPATVILQVRGEDWTGVRVAGSRLLDAGDPLPAELGTRVLVLAEELGQGRRMAARLARAGIQEVVVVRGGVEAWQAARAREAPGRRPSASRSLGEAT